jgi:hypothetical protein
MHYSPKKYEGENHLRDDEIDAYLLPVRRKLGETGNLIVSLDACHSQSANRGDNDAETVVRGTATVFSRNAGYKGRKTGENVNPPLVQAKDLSPITILSACESYQTNYEYKKGNEYYGSLTYALCSVWDSYNALPAYRMWSDEVKKIMREIAFLQTPVFETTLKE